MTSLLNNPSFKNFIDAFKQVSKNCETLSLEEGRKLSTQFFLSSETIYEPVYRIEDIVIPGNEGHQIPLRLYIPQEKKDLPVMIYYHRGGWVFGNIAEADPVCRKLANHLGCLVVSVEYRLAPEYPFPKPLEDCYQAAEWVEKNIQTFGGNSDHLILCGESAGGNLAASVALMARDQKGPQFKTQLLIYPAITSIIHETSYKTSVDQYFITKKAMEFFWQMYLSKEEDKQNPYASPDQASDHTHLPPAILITAEYDALRIEAEHYGEKLKQAGVRVDSYRIDKAIHGCIDLPFYPEESKLGWIQEIKKLLLISKAL